MSFIQFILHFIELKMRNCLGFGLLRGQNKQFEELELAVNQLKSIKIGSS